MSTFPMYRKTILWCLVFSCIVGWVAGFFVDIFANIILAPIVAFFACIVIAIFNLLFFYKKLGLEIQFILPGLLYIIFIGTLYRNSRLDLIINISTAVFNLLLGLRFYYIEKFQKKRPLSSRQIHSSGDSR
jgi:hypothetical protein